MEIKKKQEGISVPSAISFWNEISRMALVGKFPYTPNYRLLSTCASSFSFLFFLFLFFAHVFINSRDYTHTFFFPLVSQTFFLTGWASRLLERWLGSFSYFSSYHYAPPLQCQNHSANKKKNNFCFFDVGEKFFPLLIWTWHTANVCYLE